MAAPALRQATTVARIGAAALGQPIGPQFIGLATEYKGVLRYAGTDPSAVNPVLVKLIDNLSRHPVLRVGGDSTDWTWWPVSGLRQPLGISYSLTPGWIASARALAQATHARLTLGINLEADRPTLASIEAGALINGIGRQRVQALEVGNEPELYGYLPYTHHAGRPVFGRSAGYGFGGFNRDFAKIRRSLPRIPLAGPATGSFPFMSNLGRFLAAEPRVGVVTVHRYALNRCNRIPSSSGYPTVPNLLAPVASNGLMQGYAPYIALAHGHGVPFRVDEMGPVTCGGVAGISNSFASALWVLDAMFAIARSGTDGVNIQTSPFPGSPNQLFTFQDLAGQWTGSVRPEYYGLLMFAHAAAPGSRLLQIAAAPGPQLRLWATRTPTGQINVVLINDSFGRSRIVRVRAPASPGSARLERLQAPSPYATEGVTLGGQSFGPLTGTGRLSGARTSTRVKPSAGEYTVTLPAASAALLTIPARAAKNAS